MPIRPRAGRVAPEAPGGGALRSSSEGGPKALVSSPRGSSHSCSRCTVSLFPAPSAPEKTRITGTPAGRSATWAASSPTADRELGRVLAPGDLPAQLRRLEHSTSPCHSSGMADPPYVLIDTERAPIKAWVRGVPFEEEAARQLRNAASLPFIFRWVAAMPDVHWGLGATVGRRDADPGGPSCRPRSVSTSGAGWRRRGPASGRRTFRTT